MEIVDKENSALLATPRAAASHQRLPFGSSATQTRPAAEEMSSGHLSYMSHRKLKALKDITNDSLKRDNVTAAYSPAVLSGLKAKSLTFTRDAAADGRTHARAPPGAEPRPTATLHKTPSFARSKLNQVTAVPGPVHADAVVALVRDGVLEDSVYPPIEYMPPSSSCAETCTADRPHDLAHLVFPRLHLTSDPSAHFSYDVHVSDATLWHTEEDEQMDSGCEASLGGFVDVGEIESSGLLFDV